MAFSINTNISNLQLNTRALGQLDTSLEKLASGKRINSNDSPAAAEGTLRKEDVRAESTGKTTSTPEEPILSKIEKDRTVVDGTRLRQVQQPPLDTRLIDLIGTVKPLYGVECMIRLAEGGVQQLATAQQAGTSIANKALSNQAAVMSGVGRGASVESTSNNFAQLGDITADINKGKRGNAAALSLAANNTNMQAIGGERGNSALLAENYNQLMKVDLNVAAVSATQAATTAQSVLRLF